MAFAHTAEAGSVELEDFMLDVSAKLTANRRLVITLSNQTREMLVCKQSNTFQGILRVEPDRLLPEGKGTVLGIEGDESSAAQAAAGGVVLLVGDTVEALFFAWNPLDQPMVSAAIVGEAGTLSTLDPAEQLRQVFALASEDGGEGENERFRWSWSTGEFTGFDLREKEVTA